MTTKTSWRDVIRIHPAADLFPLMPPDELKALGEDIQKNGMTSPVILLGSYGRATLLDGRNRLDAMESVGMETVKDGRLSGLVASQFLSDLNDDIDPYSYVVSANIHRRHLTTAQKGELIEVLLKARPERSDRAIAKDVKVDHKTVAAKREKLEQGGEIPHHETRIGKDGVAQPAEKKPAFVPTPTRPDYSAVARVAQRVLEGQGISVPGLTTETQQATVVTPGEPKIAEPPEQAQPVEDVQQVEQPRPVEPTPAAETEPPVDRVELMALIRELSADELEQFRSRFCGCRGANGASVSYQAPAGPSMPTPEPAQVANNFSPARSSVPAPEPEQREKLPEPDGVAAGGPPEPNKPRKTREQTIDAFRRAGDLGPNQMEQMHISDDVIDQLIAEGILKGIGDRRVRYVGEMKKMA